MTNVVGMFANRADAEAAILRLRDHGIGDESISLAFKGDHPGGSAAAPDPAATGSGDMAEEGTAVGAVSGAAVGTIVGLLVAGSTFFLPGVGTLLLAGPLFSALTGAGLGAASGGLLGALLGSGIPESDARHYLSGIESGGIVLAAHVDEAIAPAVRRILDDAGSRKTHEM